MQIEMMQWLEACSLIARRKRVRMRKRPVSALKLAVQLLANQIVCLVVLVLCSIMAE